MVEPTILNQLQAVMKTLFDVRVRLESGHNGYWEARIGECLAVRQDPAEALRVALLLYGESKLRYHPELLHIT